MKVVILDGHNNFIRQYVANPTMDINGTPCGALVGLMRNVKGYLKDFRPERLVVVWDGEGGSQRRRSIYKEYKAGRKVRLNREFDADVPVNTELDNMLDQFHLTRDYLSLLGIEQVRVEQTEADDVIAYLCNQVYADDEKIVVTSDHDMFQLITPICSVFNPLKKEMLKRENVFEKHFVIPENYIIIKSLMGDKSDNIEGLKGLGEKTIVKFFPTLTERKVELEEVFDICEANKKLSHRYQLIIDNAARVKENFELMQLAAPIISATALRSIREQLENEVSLNSFQVQLNFVKDGLQIKDVDFFKSFREYGIRKKHRKENDG